MNIAVSFEFAALRHLSAYLTPRLMGFAEVFAIERCIVYLLCWYHVYVNSTFGTFSCLTTPSPV